MRIIDEKGKLFGKINMIDFLVILILFCMLPAFYFGYKILNRPVVVEKKAEDLYISINIYVMFKNLSLETAKLISAGDREIDDGGKLVGEIIDVGDIESNFIEIDLGKGGTIIREDFQRKQISVKMTLIGKLDGNVILYKENKIKINSAINFKTDEYEAKGIVIPEPDRVIKVSMPGFSLINLDLLFKNLSPEVARLISAGDFEVSGNGDIIAKVLNVGKPEPYSHKVDLGGGNYTTRTDLQKRQLLAKTEIMGRIEGNAFYFKDKRITLDSIIEFNTNKYNINGIVIKEPTPIEMAMKVPIALDLLFKNLSPEVARLISAGDFEVSGNGDIIAKVLNVGKPEPYSYKVDLGGGNYITRTDLQKRQLLAKTEIMGRIEGNAFYFKDKRIAFDSIIEFSTNKYNIKGTVNKEPTAIKKIDRKWVVLKVEFAKLMPELAVLINKGDEEKYFSRELVAKIISIFSNKPAEVVVPAQDGRLNITQHPIERDVILLMKVHCIKAQRGLFFKENRVKVGADLFLQTKEYDINGIIIGIEEVGDL